MVMRFSVKKNAGCPKAPRDFPPRKDSIFHLLVGLSWDSLPPPPESVRTGGRAGGRTLTSRPQFLGSIGYQICLAMELRWRALPASSAIILIFPASSREDNTFCRQLLGSVAQKIQNSAKKMSVKLWLPWEDLFYEQCPVVTNYSRIKLGKVRKFGGSACIL